VPLESGSLWLVQRSSLLEVKVLGVLAGPAAAGWSCRTALKPGWSLVDLADNKRVLGDQEVLLDTFKIKAIEAARQAGASDVLKSGILYFMQMQPQLRRKGKCRP